MWFWQLITVVENKEARVPPKYKKYAHFFCYIGEAIKAQVALHIGGEKQVPRSKT